MKKYILFTLLFPLLVMSSCEEEQNWIMNEIFQSELSDTTLSAEYHELNIKIVPKENSSGLPSTWNHYAITGVWDESLPGTDKWLLNAGNKSWITLQKVQKDGCDYLNVKVKSNPDEQPRAVRIMVWATKKGNENYEFTSNAIYIWQRAKGDEGELIGPVAEIPADEVPDNIKTYFGNYIDGDYEARHKVGLDLEENTCYFINSMDEFFRLQEYMHLYPNIDFGKYTLILGSFRLHNLQYHFEKLEMTEYEDHYLLKVYFSSPENVPYPTAVKTFPYWGLYPKLQQKAIKATPLLMDGTVLSVVESE